MLLTPVAGIIFLYVNNNAQREEKQQQHSDDAPERHECPAAVPANPA